MNSNVTNAMAAVRNAADFRQRLAILDRSGVGVILCRTREPYRAMEAIREYAFGEQVEFRMWSVLYGWAKYSRTDATAAPQTDNVKEIAAALTALNTTEGNNSFPDGVYVMMYPHYWLKAGNPNPTIIQLLKEYCRLFTQCEKRLILMTPTGFSLPSELEEDILILDFDAPSYSELAEAYEDIVDSFEDKKPNFTKSEVDQIIAASAGMSRYEFETALTRACVTHRKLMPNVSIDLIVEEVMRSKIEVVKRSEVLEVMKSDNMDNVGGLENLKAWLRKRAKCFSQEAADFGIETPKGIALIGPPGCLSGSTVMLYNRGARNSGREILLEDLYKKFNGIKFGKKGWDSSLPTYLHSHDADTGAVRYNRVISIIDVGIKDVVLLTTTGGRQLKLTADHPVLTEDGYVPAGELVAGQSIIVRGSMKSTESPVHYGRKPRVTVEGLKFYASGWDKVVDGYQYKRQHRARLVLEAHLNKMSYEAYLLALKTDPEAVNLQTIPNDMIVHHLDENPMNDSLVNLQLMFKVDHDALHNDEMNFNVEYTALDTVHSVEPYGVDHTYDIQMEEPCNNFATADGLLVHNTGKSLCAKATAHMLGLPLIKFDVSRVFQSLVGQSEERVRSALKMLDAMAPCVAMLDEVDKAFQLGSGGDSGVSQRVLGLILTHMQETDKPIFWVASANRVDNLPSEFLRRGRLDEVFAVSVPEEDERLEVLRIHLRKRGVDPDSVKGLEVAATRSAGYVPAEIEAAVKDALIDAFDEELEITGELIVRQLDSMKPLSEAFKEQFDRMTEWADNNARPASKKRAPAVRTRTRPALALDGKGGRAGVNLDG